MTGSNGEGPSWIQAWIEQQREQLRRAGMTGNQSADDAASDAGAAAGQMRNPGLSWLEVGQSFLHGWQQFVQQGAAGAPAGPAPPKFGEEMISAVQGAWAGTACAGEGAARQFADLAARWPALGLAREHTEAWRELMAAQAECQRLEQELRNVWAKVQADALTMVERLAHERNAARQPAEQSTADYRELYDLWVECGEKVFSQVAHSEAYCKLQAQAGNATMRLRARHQAIIERGLKQFDLPTRSELNTVHKQLRELRERVATLESQLAEARERGQP